MQGREWTILAVDDEPPILRLVQLSIQRNGFRVLTASNSDDALSLFQAHQDEVDLLLTDIRMPVMDGPALASLVHKLKPDMPILFMSGMSGAMELRSIPTRFRRIFLKKPFFPSDLLGKLRESLAASR